MSNRRSIALARRALAMTASAAKLEALRAAGTALAGCNLRSKVAADLLRAVENEEGNCFLAINPDIR